MLKTEQIPDEVIIAAREAWLRSDTTAHGDWRTAIAAAINAWPGMRLGKYRDVAGPNDRLILPLTEPRDERD